ncbi:hypothetical protein E2C01_102111 [Portunus trituberculatus]|uniref:Uncharacterized protein n=1 Tax=Portunus trituberculatus TaxID=210409 RepID=A0A5B7KHK7_PORTR|nr:hypothetical protein [Portunus trituberculatus]
MNYRPLRFLPSPSTCAMEQHCGDLSGCTNLREREE